MVDWTDNESGTDGGTLEPAEVMAWDAGPMFGQLLYKLVNQESAEWLLEETREL